MPPPLFFFAPPRQPPTLVSPTPTPSSMRCHEASGQAFDDVCERPPLRLGPNEVYINALHDTLPECDRREATVTLDALEKADRCFVYCAQRSCDAAKDFMKENRDELAAKCERITYLRDGAMGMAPATLRGGRACHDRIEEYNEKETRGAKACLTCAPGSTAVGAVVDGVPRAARYAVTDDEIPDWFVRRGIYSPLPPPFTCDPRFHPPEHHADASSPRMQLDLRGTGLPRDATIGYWASQPTDRVLEAGEAYADFGNRGITRCEGGVCELRLEFPGRYKAEGKVYNPHLHFAVWEGDRWNMTARTIEFT